MSRIAICQRRSGMALIIVLVAIMMLALAGYTFSQLMMAEREAAWAHGRTVQSRALVDSGVAFVEQQLAQPGSIDQAGGWQNNPTLFRGQLVAESDIRRDRGRFSVLSPNVQMGSVSGIRYGLEDESGRLNLNTLLLIDPTWQSLAAQGLSATQTASGAVTYGSSTSGGTSSSGGSSSSGGGSSTGTSSGGSMSSGGSLSSGSSSGSSGSSASPSSGSGSSSSSVQISAEQALLYLPGMTIEIADAILDWLDPDDLPRTYGAERDSYSGSNYAPKNGPFESVEELLLVKGVTPQLLYGADFDHNNAIGAGETAIGSMSASGSSSSGSSGSSGGGTSGISADMNRGWSAYLTVYSHESNLTPTGQPKINVNTLDLQQLYTAVSQVLGSDVATFVIAYRQGKSVTGSQTTVSIGSNSPNFNLPGNTLLASPLDLVGCKVQVTFQGQTQASVIQSPFDPTPSTLNGYISMLLDNLTIVPSLTVPGRININTASLPVLMAIPGMDPTTASMILSAQQSGGTQLGSNRNYPTWIYVEGLVTLDVMKQFMPYITSSGRVFRAQVVGFFDEGGPTSRAEVVIDATSKAPRLLLWREMTHLGAGYPPSVLGRQ